MISVRICSHNQDAIIMADDMGKVCVQTLLPDIKLPLLSIKEFFCQDENIETDYNDFSDNIADDVAFVIYSSGSTSEPKGVMVTHKGVIRMLQETAKILGLTKEDVLLSWLPVEHTFGLIYFLLLPIYVGCRQVHMATSMFAENPLTWLEQINHYRATVTAGPNFAYQIVLNNMTEKAYWLNKIDSLSSYPQIPMKMKLADCRDYNIVRKSAIIDSVLWGNFKETARRHKVSPSALLCTLYGRTMAKWGNQSEVLLNLTVFQRQQKNTGKIIGDFTKLLPLNLVFAKEDIWKSAEMVQEQIMKDLDHLSFDGTEIMRELAKRRGVFGKALLPVVFTCVLFDCPENYFERLGSIKYAVSQTPQVFLDNQITEMGGRLHISWDVVDELFEACIIDEIFLEFVEDIKRISENNKANSTNDFVTKVWGNILTKEIITKSVVPDLLKSIDLKQIKILDYAQELCPPDVKGQVYVSESEIMNDRNKTYYKILEHPLYGRMADTGIIGVLTHDGYMEFVVPNCETSVETPDKKEDTHEEEIEKPIVKEIMKIWKEVFEIEDISIQDDFYTLGGDSIILMRLVDEMCKTLGCDVTVDDILQSENISDLANRV